MKMRARDILKICQSSADYPSDNESPSRAQTLTNDSGNGRRESIGKPKWPKVVRAKSQSAPATTTLSHRTTGLIPVNPRSDEEPADIGLDIVAVHGLGGHSQNTWTWEETKYCWLEDLPERLGVRARVFTFGYDATAAFGKSTARVPHHAMNLLLLLHNNRKKPEECRRPIIFISHSLGGIVVKQAFVTSDPMFKPLQDSIHGVVFMGTPHRGSDVADVAAVLLDAVQFGLFGYQVRSNLIKNLKTNSEFLQDLSDTFGRQAARLEIISCFETQTMPKWNKVVVDRPSAILNIPGEVHFGCDASHRTICRFPSAEDGRLNDFLLIIDEMVKKAINGRMIEDPSATDPKYKECLERLHKVDYKAHLEEVYEKKSKQTGKWIYENEIFQKWKDSPGSQTLWLTGDAGSGKSVLSASIIKGLQDEFEKIESITAKPLLAFFFFDGKEQAKGNHLNGLQVLLHQILRHTKGRIDTADKFFDSTLDKCVKAIQIAIKDVPKVFLVLDAIDECTLMGGKVLGELFNLKNHTRNFKLLVTSRPHTDPNLTLVLEKNKPSIVSLTQARVQADIDKFLSQKLRTFTRIKSEEMKKEIKATILEQAGGMFLWASLAWNMFTDWKGYEWNVDGVKKRLQRLKDLGRNPDHQNVSAGSESLYIFYNAILGSLEDHKGTKKLFKWLVTAPAPLTLSELRIVYSLEPGRHTSKASLERDLDLGEFRDVVSACCGPFVRIAQASETVHLVHQSIKEFFLDPGHENGFGFSRNEAELDSARACLTYLSFTSLKGASNFSDTDPGNHQEEDIRLQKENPFLKYSILHWDDHARCVQEEPTLWETFLCWVNSGNTNLCFRIYWYFEGRGNFPEGATAMHAICYLGLEGLVRKALQQELKWATVHGCDKAGRTPLHWAAVTGHDKVVQLLLDNGAVPSRKDDSDSTPMELAVDYGHINVVRMLWENAVADENSGKWLELAAAGGHMDVLIHLLDSVGGVPPAIDEFGSALYAAAFGGHYAAVKLILERKPVAVHFASGGYGTPLSAAAFEGNIDIVKLLLEHKADPNARGGVYGYPLQAASYRGWKEIIKILLDHGAKVNAEGGVHGTALEGAKFAGNPACMKLLEAAGARNTEFAFHRRRSKFDDGAYEKFDSIEQDIRKGRAVGLEKGVEGLKADLIQAVVDGNKKRLIVCLDIAFRGYKLAVKVGRERFLVFIVGIGMSVTQEAVKRRYQEGVELMAKTWVKALIWTIKERKSQLAQRLITSCVKDLRTFIDEEKDDDTRAMITSALETYIKAVEAGNQPLIDMVSKVWVETFSDLVDGKSGDELVKTFNNFFERWIGAIQNQEETKVKVIGMAAIQGLWTSVTEKKDKVAEHLAAIYAGHLQKIVVAGGPNLEWFFAQAKRQISEIAFWTDDAMTETAVKVGVDFLLVLLRKQEYGQLRRRFVEIGVIALNAANRAGQLGKIAETVSGLAREKFEKSQDDNKIRELEVRFLAIMDETIAADKSLQTALGKVNDSIKIAASDTIDDLP